MHATNPTLSSPHQRALWLREAGWGIMCHYLDQMASSQESSVVSAEDWNRRVDRFDVDGFAADVRASGAGYVIFTIGQNSGHYCAPNATYDRIVGRKPSWLSPRDLIAEIAEALAPDVRLIAYLSSHAPSNDPLAITRLKLTPPWDTTKWGIHQHPPGSLPADSRLSEFQALWEEVVTEWAQRWGDRVAGWWIDGCYFAEAMFRHPDAPNGESFSRALRAGNEDRILAFNSGVQTLFEKVLPTQDYTAGETARNLPVADRWHPLAKEAGDMQLHLLTFLGDWWGDGLPRFPDALVHSYTGMINQAGGAVTWDVPISPEGRLPEAHLRLLSGLPRRAGADRIQAAALA